MSFNSIRSLDTIYSGNDTDDTDNRSLSTFDLDNYQNEPDSSEPEIDSSEPSDESFEHPDNQLANNYFSYVNLSEQQKCISKYINDNPLPEISFDQIQEKVSDKTSTRNKKLLKQASDEDFHVLNLGQKNELLKFFYNFKKVYEHMSFANIEYYIKAFNYCNNQNLPIVKMSYMFKDNDKYTLVLMREYNILLHQSEKMFNNRRQAMIKGVSPDYLALSKLQNKYKYFKEL
jgi:hypothetical protein